jgi:divalent metal cation (Fe/Co/Zn/Cd) transporter
MRREYPPHVEAGIRKGAKLEYWTIAWVATVVPLMFLVMGSSQAMKTVWIEDMLGFVPPVVYLISVRLERQPPTEKFPAGFDRVNSLAFAVSAAALALMGAYLLVESGMTLAMKEHATVGTTRLFGRDIWLGWPMILVLLWSTIPSMILGRLKLPVAREINDKVLHTDAEMQKADWMTGIAAIGGIVGIGFGFWWADAAAAGFISLGIIHDGMKELRSATAELVDGAPRKLEEDVVAPEAEALRRVLEQRFGGSVVRLRESGRLIHAQVVSASPEEELDLAALWPGDPSRNWRLAQVSFVPEAATAPSAAPPPPG